MFTGFISKYTANHMLVNCKQFPQSTITLEGNKMIHNQIGDKKKEEKDSVLTREFTDTEMIMVRF